MRHAHLLLQRAGVKIQNLSDLSVTADLLKDDRLAGLLMKKHARQNDRINPADVADHQLGPQADCLQRPRHHLTVRRVGIAGQAREDSRLGIGLMQSPREPRDNHKTGMRAGVRQDAWRGCVRLGGRLRLAQAAHLRGSTTVLNTAAFGALSALLS